MIESWNKLAIDARPPDRLPDDMTIITTKIAWAEDRATRGRDPSADSGAKAEGRAVSAYRSAAFLPSLRFLQKGDKSSRHDAANRTARGQSQVANSARRNSSFR